MRAFLLTAGVILLSSGFVNAQADKAKLKNPASKSTRGKQATDSEKSALKARPRMSVANPPQIIDLRMRLGAPLVRAYEVDPFDSKRFISVVKTEIERMTEVCGLSKKQVRKLRLVAKGTANKLQQADNEKVAKRQADPDALVPKLTVRLDNRLNNHPFWQRYLKRILTKEQWASWADRDAFVDWKDWPQPAGPAT